MQAVTLAGMTQPPFVLGQTPATPPRTPTWKIVAGVALLAGTLWLVGSTVTRMQEPSGGGGGGQSDSDAKSDVIVSECTGSGSTYTAYVYVKNTTSRTAD